MFDRTWTTLVRCMQGRCRTTISDISEGGQARKRQPDAFGGHVRTAIAGSCVDTATAPYCIHELVIRPALMAALAVILLIGALPAAAAGAERLPREFVYANAPGFIGHHREFIRASAPTSAPAAAQDLCTTYPWACARSGDRRPLSAAQLGTIVAVNLRVNRTTRSITDRAQYGVEDHWALPTRRGGDCEDFALLKKLELIRAGIAPERMLIATLLDRRRQPHAVLVVRTDHGDFVLDNLTNRILSWQKTDYTFLKIQDPDAPHRWRGILTGGMLSS